MSKINDILNQFKKLNVLIVGDVMIDRYMYGKVNRISPEAPVPVVELQKQEDRLGGAANVALNIKALGATPYLYSFVGADTEGGVFQALLADLDLPTQGIIPSWERVSTVKTRIMAGTHQMLRVDSEITTDLSEELEMEFLKKIRELLDVTPIHVIIFQDYNKGVLTRHIIKEVMSEAINREIPTIVDPKKKHFLDYQHATIFKPNLKEIREAVPFEVKADLESLQKAADYLRTHLNHDCTMITLSEKGIFCEGNIYQTSHNEAFNELKTGQIYPTKPRNITDVSGAGDTVVSVAALGLASSLSKEIIVILSNLAGGQVCETAGVVPVDPQLLAKEFDNIFV
jgi:D-glycero-beta-D-manno-heptose-7-phosphate kinase